jgi:HK97 family phage portal protein
MPNIFTDFLKKNIKRSSQLGSNIQNVRSFDFKKLAAYAQAYDIEFDNFNQSEAINRIGVVYQCVDILANTIARIPSNIITDIQGDGDFEDFKNHFWYKQIKFKPNGLQSDFEFKRMIATAIFTKGNAYVYVNRINQQLEFIHPDLIDDIKIVNGQRFYFSTQLNYTFLQNEIIHYKKISTDGLKGLSPMEAIRTNVNIMHLAEKTTEEYYKHGARSPLAIERDIDKSVNQSSLDESIAEMQSKNMNGRFSIREPLVLPPTLRIKELKLTQEDMMFVAVAQYTNEQIANLFGIPSYLIYATKGVAGKFEQENLAFKNTTIGNYLEMYRATTVDSLISIEDRIDLNANITFDINKLMDMDYTSIATNAIQLSNNGIISKNSARQMLNLKRINDPNMDLHFSQGQNLPIEGRDFTTMQPPEAAPIN